MCRKTEEQPGSIASKILIFQISHILKVIILSKRLLIYSFLNLTFIRSTQVIYKIFHFKYDRHKTNNSNECFSIGILTKFFMFDSSTQNNVKLTSKMSSIEIELEKNFASKDVNESKRTISAGGKILIGLSGR